MVQNYWTLQLLREGSLALAGTKNIIVPSTNIYWLPDLGESKQPWSLPSQLLTDFNRETGHKSTFVIHVAMVGEQTSGGLKLKKNVCSEYRPVEMWTDLERLLYRVNILFSCEFLRSKKKHIEKPWNKLW